MRHAHLSEDIKLPGRELLLAQHITLDPFLEAEIVGGGNQPVAIHHLSTTSLLTHLTAIAAVVDAASSPAPTSPSVSFLCFKPSGG